MADAFRAAGKADFALMNDGGIRADIPAGAVTYGTLYEVSPFGNQLYLVTLQGADLRQWLERQTTRGAPRWHVAGFTARYDLSRPALQRITAITLADGRPLDDAATYTLVASDFILAGGDGAALGSRGAPRSLELSDLDALLRHARALPDGLVVADGGARLIPEPR